MNLSSSPNQQQFQKKRQVITGEFKRENIVSGKQSLVTHAHNT